MHRHQHLRTRASLAALACLCVLLVNVGAAGAHSEPTHKEAGAPALPTIPANESVDVRKEEPAVETSPSAKKEAELPKEPVREDESARTASSDVKPDGAPETASPQATSQEAVKDLKSLLESKNDSENDLGPAQVASGAPAPQPEPEPKAEHAPAVIKTQFAGEASPGADKSLDERFHYSIGGEKPLEGKKEEPVSVDERPKKEKEAEEAVRPAAAAPTDEQPEEPAKKDTGETEEEDVKEAELESEQSSSSTRAPASGTTVSTTGSPASATSSPKPVVVEAKIDEEKALTTSTPAQPPVESTEKAAAKESEVAGGNKAASVSPTEPAEKETAVPSTTPKQVTPNSTTTTSSPASTPLSAKSDSEEKPSVASSVSSIATAAAAAAGSSLGSALGSAIGSSISGKANPSETKPVATSAAPVPSPSSSSATSANSATSATSATSSTTSTTTTTTRAPASRRKSTTDRWSRWQPSSAPSSSETPPSRRRPVLPSIRRRFRPYNRFSPFPWAPGGPEVYSPFGQPEEPTLNAADAEPDFGSSPVDRATRPPKRRAGESSGAGGSSSSTELPPWKSSTARPRLGITESTAESEEQAPSVSSRRRPAEAGGNRRHPSSTNRFPDYESNRMPDWSESGSGFDRPSHRPPQRHHKRPHHNHHNRNHHRPRYDERPYLSEPSLFNPTRPQTPGFGLFNSAGSSPTGSGFDLLNPFSWVDEITKPLRNHNRPALESGRPAGPHIGPGGRPSGPIPVEGEYNGARPGPFEGGAAEHPHQPGMHHEHDHHRPHRPHRPIGSGSRDDYYDGHHHDCHHEHEHEHEHDHHHDHHRPHRPLRPDEYEDYSGGRPGRRPLVSGIGGGGGFRPDRPYFNRRDQSTPAPSEHGGSGHGSQGAPSGSQGSSSSSSNNNNNNGDSTIVHDNETLNPPGERQASRGAERQAGGRPSLQRVPMFSPFDSLFGSLDEELFGGLRSSFVDAPMKASGEVVSRVDAIVNSPKISLPAAPAGQANRKPVSESAAPSSRLTSAELAPKAAEESAKPVDKREPKAGSGDSPLEINRGGIRHFLLMI